MESVDKLLYYVFMLKNYAKEKIEKVRAFSEKRKAYIMPLVLVGGFLLDIVTLRDVDGVFDNVLLITHLLIVGACIFLLFAKDTSWSKRLGILNRSSYIEYMMLFSFGAVFSGSIIFYSKSASYSSSWPFFVLLLILMLATEFQKKYFQRLILQINFYFIALFSYLIVLVPVLRKQIGAGIFFASGFLALILIFIFFGILYLADKKKLGLHLKKLVLGTLSIFVFFNLLYFSNIIPPIPLSLKFSAVYHNVYRSGGDYVALYESTPFWNVLRKRSRVVNRHNDSSVYVFSSIFAPINLNTTIYHQWQYYDPIDYRWVNSTRVSIPISGGRRDGYRGYSYKRNLHEGRWRVLVETPRGQKLGQIRFIIKSADGEVELREEIL